MTKEKECPCLDKLEKYIEKYVKDLELEVGIPTCDIADVYHWIEKVRKWNTRRIKNRNYDKSNENIS